MTTTDRSLKSASSDVEGEEKHVESVEETQPHTHPADFTQDEIEFMEGFTKEQRKKVIRKVRVITLCPVCTITNVTLSGGLALDPSSRYPLPYEPSRPCEHWKRKHRRPIG